MIDEIKEELRVHAKEIDAISTRRLMARPSYDIMSSAIVWPDEIKGLSTETIWALRPVFRYRTSQFTGQVDSQWASIWEDARQLFPNWIGFHRSRTNPGRNIVKLYERKSGEANRSIQAMIN